MIARDLDHIMGSLWTVPQSRTLTVDLASLKPALVRVSVARGSLSARGRARRTLELKCFVRFCGAWTAAARAALQLAAHAVEPVTDDSAGKTVSRHGHRRQRVPTVACGVVGLEIAEHTHHFAVEVFAAERVD